MIEDSKIEPVLRRHHGVVMIDLRSRHSTEDGVTLTGAFRQCERRVGWGRFGRVGAVNEVVVGVTLTGVLEGVSAGWRHSRGLSLESC